MNMHQMNKPWILVSTFMSPTTSHYVPYNLGLHQIARVAYDLFSKLCFYTLKKKQVKNS